MDESVYLRQNVCVKPLVAGWCATEQLIPPVQAALNFKNVYLDLLRSYLDAPSYHWSGWTGNGACTWHGPCTVQG